MNLTDQQSAFVTAVRETSDNLALIARAGCGKTSTILFAVDEIARTGAEVAVVAFNKAIADEVKEKLTARGHTNWKKVQASTLHGMGFGLLRFAFKGVKVEDRKVPLLVQGLNDPDAEPLAGAITQLVRTAKQEGFGFFDDRQIGDAGAWYRMADHYGINGFDDTSMMDGAVELAQRVYRLSLRDTSTIDFDDMILFPLVKNLRVGFPKDVIIVDEAQDLSRARQALARKFVKPTGRMIIVGDDRQAIYGFSGADADALSNMVEQLQARTLPLSITWRCPRAVVAEAQRLVPDIEASPSAAEGEVRHLDTLPEDLAPGDAVLCRNTAPLIGRAYSLIRRGIPAKVEGREIGEGLKTLARRWEVKTIDALLNRLDQYEERETQKARAKGRPERVDAIIDRVETLREICRECLLRNLKTVADVETFITALFADGDTRSVVLATYHRSKGREWPRVYLLEHAKRCPSPFAKQAWQLRQEDNLAYVAITRAREVLTYVG